MFSNPSPRQHRKRVDGLLWLVSLVLLMTLVIPAFGQPVGNPGRIHKATLLFHNGLNRPLTTAPPATSSTDRSLPGEQGVQRVRQQFRNPGDKWREGLFVFRPRANKRLLSVSIKVNNNPRPARLMRLKAGNEDISPRFGAAVGNIAPGATITVERRYRTATTQGTLARNANRTAEEVFTLASIETPTGRQQPRH